MSNYKTYIIAAVLLVAGVAIGWLIKPGTNAAMTTDHSL